MKQVWEKVVSLAGSNFGLKVLALIIAVGLWMAGHRDTERAIEVPLEFRNIPADLMVMDNRIDYVVLRLMGPRTLVSTLDADNLKLSLDLDGVKSGTLSYPLAPNDFSVPRGVTVARITPPVVHLRLEPVAKRTLPVNRWTVTVLRKRKRNPKLFPCRDRLKWCANWQRLKPCQWTWNKVGARSSAECVCPTMVSHCRLFQTRWRSRS
jgi:hypothetical protein